MRQFRKYPNRRIYDLDNSKYVTLDDLLNWINAGASIHVEEAESGEDLTQATLMQILSKEESRRSSPLLTNLALEQLIRFTSNPYAEAASQFIEQSLEFMASDSNIFMKGFKRSAESSPFNVFKAYADLWSKE
ncbi:MAG TPA: hypothetical protein DCP57_02785 [Gammaproteobacteria bacterium]|jgi:polyhydroxyalkanoate synthesis repressor PhaR|nr:MAG: hypothetical protein EVA67_10470 [OM182 bacterium]HAL41344.1 hypothetical protein [Gammaproteobacteria bacterium]HBK18666.1 hypothetical protein [Gammaproteobacteria bacterium]|tara:strand:- start:1538 stop:1936 length:399 start_codon:yes stop_codon:yes gene_type:complete